MASVSSSQTATSSEPHTLLFLICHIYPSQHDRPTFFRTCTTVLCCQSANFATTILRLDSPSSKCKFSTVSRSSSPANVIPALAFGTSHSNRPPLFYRLPHRVPILSRLQPQVPTSLHRQPTTCTNYSASKTSCNQAAGSPVTSTWIKAIDAGFFTTWPNLTSELVKVSGHRQRTPPSRTSRPPIHPAETCHPHHPRSRP